VEPEDPGKVGVYTFTLKVVAEGGAYLTETDVYTLAVGCAPSLITVADPEEFQAEIALFVGDPTEGVYTIPDLIITGTGMPADMACPVANYELIVVSAAEYREPGIYNYEDQPESPLAVGDNCDS